MRNFYFPMALLLSFSAWTQNTVSISLYDEKNNALSQADVDSILVKIFRPDSTTLIYSESFDPLVNLGIAHLDLGTGEKTGADDYRSALNKYFESIPNDLKPTDEDQLVVKIEVRLKNGKSIESTAGYKVNNPIPLVKGDQKNGFYLKFNELAGWSFGAGTEMKLKPNSLSFDTEESSAKLFPDGLTLEDREKIGSFNLSDGLIIKDLDGSYTQIKDKSITLHNSNNSDWGLGQAGLTLDEAALRLWQIYRDGFEYKPDETKSIKLDNNSLHFDDHNAGMNSKIGFYGLKIQNKDQFGWDLNLNGGTYKFNNDKSSSWNADYIGVNNFLNKHETRLLENGTISYFDNNPIVNLGTTPSGYPFFGFKRTNGNSIYSSGLNPDFALDQAGFNPQGQITSRITTLTGSGGFNPFFYITQDGGAPGAGMYYNNQNVPVLFASIKNFRMDHPFKPDQDIVYASLEGPEAAAYCRGKAQISSGKIFIPFPEHFRYVCSPDDLTVQLTPRSALSKGLAVTQIGPEGFQVEELMNGKGSYEFYWEVKGVRKGFENYQVLRPKSEIMPVPFKRPGTKE